MHGLKLTTIAALAASVSLVLATPPACLLACVAQVEKNSKCSSLADLECICTSIGEEVEKCLDSQCPDGDADTAKKAFEASCKEQGHDVSGADSSSSDSSSSSSSAASSSASSADPSSSDAPSSSPAATSETPSSSPAASSEAASSSAKSSVAASSFVSSEAPSSSAQTTADPSSTLVTSSSAAASSSAGVSSFEDGGKMMAASFGAVIAGVVGALL